MDRTGTRGADAPAVLVELLATRWPDMRARLLAEHTPDEKGRCRGCTVPGYGTPGGHWPCLLATLATLAERQAEVALDGSKFDRRRADSPSPVGARPWGLRRARPAGPGHPVPGWRYDEQSQMAVEIATGLPPIVAGPTANTTSSTDGEDGPSSEDWNND